MRSGEGVQRSEPRRVKTEVVAVNASVDQLPTRGPVTRRKATFGPFAKDLRNATGDRRLGRALHEEPDIVVCEMIDSETIHLASSW